jgi:hypothetical protein
MSYQVVLGLGTLADLMLGQLTGGMAVPVVRVFSAGVSSTPTLPAQLLLYYVKALVRL